MNREARHSSGKVSRYSINFFGARQLRRMCVVWVSRRTCNHEPPPFFHSFSSRSCAMHRCYIWTFARTTHLLPSLVREPRMLHEYFFWCEVLFVAPTKHLAFSIYFITAPQHKRRAMRGGERLCTLCRDNFGRTMSVLLSSGVRARDCTEDMPAKKRKHTDRHGSRSPIAPVGPPISPLC